MSTNSKTFHAVAIGQSHLKKGIPCQDAAISYEDHANEIYIGVVSDGHGSKDYFRSDIGSSILVKESLALLKTFAEAQKNSLFQETYVTRQTLTQLSQHTDPDTSTSPSPQIKLNEEVLNHLFKSIISKWRESIETHWQENLPSENLLISKGFSKDRIVQYLNNQKIEIAYGCTLLAFLKTKNYWIAFQLGDGMCVAFDEDVNAFTPIPKDPLCEGNTTTSMCEINAFENFRYAYGTKKLTSLFIGSDGMEGRYGDLDFYTIPEITKDYEVLTKMFLANGGAQGVAMLNEALPIWSLKDVNQKDDLSVAGWVNLKKADDALKIIIAKEKQIAELQLKETEKTLAKEEKELQNHNAILIEKQKNLSDLEHQLNILETNSGQLELLIKNLQKNIAVEQSKQLEIKNKLETIINQKQALTIELTTMTHKKENKIKTLEKIKMLKEKAALVLEKFTT